MNNDLIYKALSEVYIHLKQSENVYKQYINDGQTYLHAKSLKVHNLKIKEILQANSSLLSESLRNDSSLLIAHYNAWLNKWNQLDESLQHNLDDKFVFENDHTFPKEACKNIENEYLRLQKENT